MIYQELFLFLFKIIRKKMVEFDELEEVVIASKYSKKIILHNDDFNSFEHVIRCLRIYVGYKFDDAVESAKRVHFEGHDIIIEGEEDELNPIYTNLYHEGLTVSIE